MKRPYRSIWPYDGGYVARDDKEPIEPITRDHLLKDILGEEPEAEHLGALLQSYFPVGNDAVKWLENPLVELFGKSPAEHIRSGGSLEDLEKVLHDFETS